VSGVSSFGKRREQGRDLFGLYASRADANFLDYGSKNVVESPADTTHTGLAVHSFDF